MKNLVDFLKKNNKTISSMESCTGGMFASEITNISGSSDVFKAGLVTYCNEYKIKFGVSKNVIDEYTVYSINTAMEMAKSVANMMSANYGIGITGQLGDIDESNPNNKPNTVYFAIFDKYNNSYITETIRVNGRY